MNVFRWVVSGALVLMGTPLLWSVLAAAARPAEATPWLASPATATSCVMDPTVMRYEHPSYLRNLRDRVVRDGDRSALGSHRSSGMSSCTTCHTDRARFCDQCHNRASVRLDCFGCHD